MIAFEDEEKKKTVWVDIRLYKDDNENVLPLKKIYIKPEELKELIPYMIEQKPCSFYNGKRRIWSNQNKEYIFMYDINVQKLDGKMSFIRLTKNEIKSIDFIKNEILNHYNNQLTYE